LGSGLVICPACGFAAFCRPLPGLRHPAVCRPHDAGCGVPKPSRSLHRKAWLHCQDAKRRLRLEYWIQLFPSDPPVSTQGALSASWRTRSQTSSYRHGGKPSVAHWVRSEAKQGWSSTSALATLVGNAAPSRSSCISARRLLFSGYSHSAPADGLPHFAHYPKARRNRSSCRSFSAAKPCFAPGSSWSGCLPRPVPRPPARGRRRCSSTTSRARSSR